MNPKIIAVDFDGTLCTHKFPEIGEVLLKHKKVVEYIKREQKNGSTLILWTCRSDTPERKYLTEAIEWCKKYHNLTFDHVNAFYQSEFDGYMSPKVYADIYLDDKALNIKDVV